jgi:hypothetical protein
MDQHFSFVLKMTSLGGVLQRGLDVGYVMFDVCWVVEMSDIMHY